ncbi:MAG: ATP phosphoribosyltransferase [Gammaproteobacteria bacterium]|nr:ATP phosphoribosyltransferase [Gammaproteobacteria bacterium]
MDNNRIKIAIQKSGRLTEHTINLLNKCGLVISHTKNQLIGYGENMPFDLMFVRDDDIPGLVQDNLCTLGIVGLNEALEKKIEIENSKKGSSKFKIVSNLDYGQCKLSFAYPDNSNYQDLEKLEGKTVATSYPNIVKDYILKNGLNIDVTQFSGAVELAPSLGKADLICDLVSSGQTLKSHNLTEGQMILESTAVVIRSMQSTDSIQSNWVNKLIERIQGVLQVKESKYIMMHAPRASIDSITDLLPGTESPTIIPLEGTTETVALHVVCKENIFWETLEDLKTKGASSILVVPVEKMLM